MSEDVRHQEILNAIFSLHKELALLRAALKPAPSAQNSASSGAATDAVLDSQFGDPEIRKDPPKWTGKSYVGFKYSQTEPAYLDSLAGFLEWKAGKPLPGKEKCADYDRRDAERARGWARRLASTAVPKPAPDRGYPAAFDVDSVDEDLGL